MDNQDRMDTSLHVLVSSEERELWKEAAWYRRVSLSEWCRKVLTATAESTMRERDEKEKSS